VTWTVQKIPAKEGKAFIRQHHYTGGCHNGPMVWGLIDPSGNLRGACAFATPCSEAVRASVFGADHKDAVTELHRLVVEEGARTDAPPTSWFVSRALRGVGEYRPALRGILSYADASEGHHGGIYQALNFLYCGTSGTSVFYRDPDGRLRHPRQCGVNITRLEAAKRGWVPERRASKHRYLALIGDRRARSWARRHLLLDVLPYPKPDRPLDPIEGGPP